MWFTGKEYPHEVFLSHAVEDKEGIANELCEKLTAKGIKIWYSGRELAGGESITNLIHNAIKKSRFGVVVLSPEFYTSIWTMKELSWLEGRELEEKNVILPVIYNMTVEEVAAKSPKLAEKVCLEAKKGMDYVVDKIFHEVEKYRKIKNDARRRAIRVMLLAAFILIATVSISTFRIYTHRPKPAQIEAVIDGRVTTFLNTINGKYADALKAESAGLINELKVDSLVRSYQNYKSYYRNEYEFNNGLKTIRGRQNVEDAIQVNLVQLADQPGYGMDSLDIYLVNVAPKDGFRHSRFSLLNKKPVAYTFNERRDGSTFSVEVKYINAIRYIDVFLTLPGASNGTKRHEMTLLGFLPVETYHFEEVDDGEWILKSIE